MRPGKPAARYRSRRRCRRRSRQPFRSGQHYKQPLLEHNQNGDIDPTFAITHTLSLEEAPHGYDIFKNKRDNCEKVVLKA